MMMSFHWPHQTVWHGGSTLRCLDSGGSVLIIATCGFAGYAVAGADRVVGGRAVPICRPSHQRLTVCWAVATCVQNLRPGAGRP
jgi:hypothetical protein